MRIKYDDIFNEHIAHKMVEILYINIIITITMCLVAQ